MTPCSLCGKRTRNVGLHLHMAHGAQPLAPGVPSLAAIRHAIDRADEVEVERAYQLITSSGRARCPKLRHDERMATAVACIRRGHRYQAPKRLGINGQTIKALNVLVAERAL